MRLCYPFMYQKNIYAIDYELLKNKGVKYLVFDLDNTIGLIDDSICAKKTENFINNLCADFTIIIASNNKHARVSLFCQNLKADMLSSSMKPTRKLYNYLIKKYTHKMSEVCVIGDQIVTDIICGNRFKMYTILVDPLKQKDLKITKFNRFLERIIMKKMKLIRGEYYEKK